MEQNAFGNVNIQFSLLCLSKGRQARERMTLVSFHKIHFYSKLKRNELYSSIKMSRCLNTAGQRYAYIIYINAAARNG